MSRDALEVLRRRLAVAVTGHYWNKSGEIAGLIKGPWAHDTELQGTPQKAFSREGDEGAGAFVPLCRALGRGDLLRGEEIQMRVGEDPAWTMNLVEEERKSKEGLVDLPPGQERRGGEEEKKDKDREKEKN